MLPSGLDEDVARISIPSTGRPESLAEAQIIKLGDSVVRLRAVAEDRRLADQPLGALLQAPSGAVEGIRAHHPLRCAEVTEWRSDIHGLEMAMRCSTLLCAPLFFQGQNENSTHAVLGRGNESPSGGAAPHDIEVSAHAPPVAGTTGAPQDLNHVTMADAEYFSFLLERMVRKVSTTESRLWRCRAVATFFTFL